MTVLGKGTPSYAFAATHGTVRHFTSPSDVIDSIDSDLESTIALVESGGTTFLSPILGRLGGIICRDGTLRSHLAIVSREFEVPCLLGVDLTGDIADGTELVLDVVDGAGLVRTRDDAGSGATRPAAPADTSIPMRTQDDAGSGATGPAASTDGPPDVSADWWAYVRRVGDDIAVKDFDVTVTPEALRALIAEELTDDRLDDLVQHMGRAFKPEITRRSGFTSELFPMLPYMTLSVIDDFHTYAERIAVIDAAMPAEEIGRRLRAQPGL